jgi:hypothetical protein
MGELICPDVVTMKPVKARRFVGDLLFIRVLK